MVIPNVGTVLTFRDGRKLWAEEARKLGASEEEIRTRRTGRSTGIALSALGRAMRHPGEAIVFRDHSDHRKANRDPFDKARHIVQDLKLQCFVFNCSGCTVTYDING